MMFLSFFALILMTSGQQTPATDAPLRLTLKRAIEVAMEDNARVRIASEGVRQADSRVRQALAPLLPNFEGQASFANQTRNLSAFGLRGTPGVVGPFRVFDVRAAGRQMIFDAPAIRTYQSARAARNASRNDVDAAVEQAAAGVARAYLAVLRAEAEVQAVDANITLAEAILKQAEDMRAAGTGTGMEITRSQVQLAQQRQRRVVAENAQRRSRLQLLRLMGLDLNTGLTLEDTLEYRPVDPAVIAAALQKALSARPEYLSQIQREDSARLAGSSALAERFPSLAFIGDYGRIGTSLADLEVTRVYGFSARIPVFDGGRVDARRAEAASLLRAQQIRTRDLAEQIALEVRIAVDSLDAADAEVRVAREALGLAEAELEQARRRYAAGVAPQLELTAAQNQMAWARDALVTALSHHLEARIDLAQATGSVRTDIN